MRLNLSTASERYELFPPTEDGDPAIVIIARPAFADVIEEAKGDDTLFEHGEQILELIEAAGGEDAKMSPALLQAHGKAGVLFARAVGRLVIEGWEGVADPDGTPAPVTPDRVDAFIGIQPIYEAFGEKYLSKWLTVQREKNVSAPSLTGTSEGAQPTARRVRGSAKSAQKKSSGRKP
ncbi:hypothetical protein [Albibacillus kandeliae]|uniref:hypothetical protein n=1 Tax=Albibacillus kandeliae TaxID=2174228 RepID=UPI000D695008|nr:hypothetical protein [Albibacillus kandeliae]